jgi:hypothetical protein
MREIEQALELLRQAWRTRTFPTVRIRVVLSHVFAALSELLEVLSRCTKFPEFWIASVLKSRTE